VATIAAKNAQRTALFKRKTGGTWVAQHEYSSQLSSTHSPSVTWPLHEDALAHSCLCSRGGVAHNATNNPEEAWQEGKQ
jgi:hypothetical protein